MMIDYGFKYLPDTILRIADTEDYSWLIQPELKAISDGLRYVEEGRQNYFYRGYINRERQAEGVGMKRFHDDQIILGEYHQNFLNGIGKMCYKSGDSF